MGKKDVEIVGRGEDFGDKIRYRCISAEALLEACFQPATMLTIVCSLFVSPDHVGEQQHGVQV